MAILENEPAFNNAEPFFSNMVFSGNSVLFKFKQKIIGSTGNYGTKKTEKMVPVKDLSNFFENS